MNKKIKTLKKSVVEGQISDDIKLEEKKDIKKEASTINTKENSIKSKKVLVKTEYLFGKCVVESDTITVYEKHFPTGKVKNTYLKKGDTFFFDHMHTIEDKIYVSWGIVSGRGYVLYKDLKTNNNPVSKIG